MFKTIEWKDDRVVMIDQRLLPKEEKYRVCEDFLDVAEAIREMVIRGAPAIGVAAAFGIALGVQGIGEGEDFSKAFERICKVMASTRPTAKNLFWAIERMKGIVEANRDASLKELKDLVKEEAFRIYREDIEINMAIGRNGEPLIEDGARILTHCNAGALATAGYGTAIGVIRAAFEKGKKIHVFVDETRPFLQGARLTTWELKELGIPFTLITDNMAGHFMQKGMVDVVIVGADRIASNGDTANKIGTYTLAVLAKEHGIPFYVAAPFSTIDLRIEDGRGIPIEERDPDEVTHIGDIEIAPHGVDVKNPAFDITPHHLISSIITEKGVISPPFKDGLARLGWKSQR